MTNSIKGPDNSGRPPLSGGVREGESGATFHQVIDQLLSGRGDGQTRLQTRQGTGSDMPSGGANIGTRQDVMRVFSADRGSRLSEAWTDFVAGSRSFADLLDQVVGSGTQGSGQTDTRTGLASQFRTHLILSDLLPPSLTTPGPPLSNPSLRSISGEDVRILTETTSTLIDTILGKAGESSPLPDHLSQTGLTELRKEAERIALSLPEGDRSEAVRSLARQVIFEGALLPELLSLTAKPDGSKTLGMAALTLHALLSDKALAHVSPDFAANLGSLRSGLETRVDDLLRALRLPGFTD